MTGMGSDGTLGAKAIRLAGGEIIQDQATSVVWRMPGSVAAAGLADQIYPLSSLAPAILRRVSLRRAPVLRATAGVSP